MRIGVISDTHGLFDEAIPSIFDGVDAIIHAGDIGKLQVIDRLAEIAQVFAVRGNNDNPTSLTTLPNERVEELAGRRVMIRHIFGELHQLRESDRRMVEDVRPHVVVFGHSHRPYQQMLGTTLLFNPGSAGPRRFSLPRTVGILSLEPPAVDARIISLD